MKSKPNKPFKTYRQQLKILRDRGLIINNGSAAISILKRDNYYSIINGYKDIFLLQQGQNEQFFQGTKFEHINALKEFDKEIRHLFLYHILTFEALLKTKISYYHTKEFDEIFNYLDVNNFEGKANEVTKLVSSISKEIEKHTNTKKPNTFSHYVENHGELPLWVLFQKATFGTASHFFSSLRPKLKDVICAELNDEHSKRYGLINFKYITPLFLENTIHFINSYRNICAHNERMFIATFNNRNNFANYSAYSKIQFRGSVFDLLIILKLFLLKNDFKKLTSDFKKHLSTLEKELSDNLAAYIKIRNAHLKVPINWENILNNFWK
ncbi:Abi family protein [Fusobacterium nucleatum]|jgi:Abortive infection bacteriophage resistance protein|uniref:Abi family protein n=1 Tax=Fusobacterium vincentii TaxID=155615 RepID=UPI00041E088F|nr:Abi family protein [Fusobacterium vincentii]ALF20084.1 hypothetical protein RN99_06210 [Fusobacterium vincentii ChDC F8]PIH02255.1 hypothetical protein CS399_07810 [Fusobacterium vincentii]QYR57251.1 Abi family protein [Fusobacterium vincentii]